MNTKEIINKMIKSGLMVAGMMGAVTLNAWHCPHCHRDHKGPVCPVSGERSDGSRYEGWERDVDSDDRNALAPQVSPYIIDGKPVKVAGRMSDGTLVYGPIKDRSYLTTEGKVVQNLNERWVYEIFLVPDMFISESGEVLDKDGRPLVQVGTMADGYPVYRTPTGTRTGIRDYVTYIYNEDITPYTRFNVKSILHDAKYAKIQPVHYIHDRFVYTWRKVYGKSSDELGGAYFDGLRWIDEDTGNVYNSPEEKGYVSFFPFLPISDS